MLALEVKCREFVRGREGFEGLHERNGYNVHKTLIRASS